MTVYIAPEVSDILSLHPDLQTPEFRTRSIPAQLLAQAETVLTAHKAHDDRIAMHVVCWWPGARGQTLDQVMTAPFDLSDAKTTLAREYGFSDWNAVVALGDRAPDPAFELALDDMQSGQIAGLTARLTHQPDLATARSRFGHGATLLHYLGANGVESHRQCLALNAVTMARLLISFGARTTDTANMYGGGQTPFDLASTSAHPYSAGIAKDLMQVLKNG